MSSTLLNENNLFLNFINISYNSFFSKDMFLPFMYTNKDIICYYLLLLFIGKKKIFF